MHITGMVHVNVNCSDYERSLRFYETLGFRVLWEVPEVSSREVAAAVGMPPYKVRGALIALAGGGSTLIDLLEWKDPRDDAAPYPHLYHLGLITGVSLEFHAHIQVFNALKEGTGHLAHQVLAVFAVGHLRWHGHFQAITYVSVFHRLLNAGNDLGAAVDKVQRLAAFRRIHQLTDAVLEHVMDGKNIRPGVRVIGLH